MAKPKNTETAVVPATVSGPDEFTQALIAAGFIDAATGGTDFHRIKMSGSNLEYDGEVIASYNAKTKEPMLYVQIADQVAEYQSMWFPKPGEPGGELAQFVGRPEMAGRMCRSWFDNPDQNRRFAEDGTSCDTCPVHPFVPRNKLPDEADGKKCSWRADIEFKILERQEDGTFLSSDDTIYTMSLPTTGVIEFKGSNSKKANQMAGSVSPENFMVKLAKLGMEKWGKEGLMKAITALRLGGVIAAVRILPAKSDDGFRSYNVASFEPIDILDVAENPQIEAGEAAPDADNLPF